MNESIFKLLNICLEYNKKDSFTVFFSFVGHVNRIEVDCYKFGWESMADADLTLCWHFDEDIDATFEFCEEAGQRIITMYKESRKALEQINVRANYGKPYLEAHALIRNNLALDDELAKTLLETLRKDGIKGVIQQLGRLTNEAAQI